MCGTAGGATTGPGVRPAGTGRAGALHRIGVDGAARARGQPVERIVFHDAVRGRTQVSFPVPRRWTLGVLRREFLADLEAVVATPVERRRTAVAVGADGSGRDAADLPPRFRGVADGHRVRFARGRFATTASFPAGRGQLTLALGVAEPTRQALWAEAGLDPATGWGTVPGSVRRALALRMVRDTPDPDGVLAPALDLVRDWEGPDTYLWSLRDTDPLPTPWAPDAPVVLLGDAAHAFLPTIGTGASLAIEDAEVLVRRLAGHLGAGGGRTSPDALRSQVLVPFGAERYPVWRDLVRRARAATVNWRHDLHRDRFLVWPYVPGRFAAAAVRAGEAALDSPAARALARSRPAPPLGRATA